MERAGAYYYGEGALQMRANKMHPPASIARNAAFDGIIARRLPLIAVGRCGANHGQVVNEHFAANGIIVLDGPNATATKREQA